MTERPAPSDGSSECLSEPLPLGADEFSACMAALGLERSPHKIAVAVSGGADSMALMVLADRWARALGGAAIGITVDHGLRAEAAEEARTVGAWLNARSIEHHVLKWEGSEKIESAVQERARDARYHLMASWCSTHGVDHLLVGHHMEDQAETFLMRLGHESGLDGLAAMAAKRDAFDGFGLSLLRPLLAISKARLCQTLNGLDQPWIEDPSNTNPAFERVRTRSLLRQLGRLEGISPEHLAGAARGAGAVRRVLEGAVDAFLAKHQGALASASRGAQLPLMAFLDLPDELQRRTLVRLVAGIGGDKYPPAALKMARLLAWLRGEKAATGRTLGHCRFERKGALLHVTPERPRHSPMVNNITEQNRGVSLVQTPDMPYILGNGQDEKPAVHPLHKGP